MNCWNFCISWILSHNNQNYKESDSIFSEIFPWVSLLSKIWLLLLDFSLKVEIIHENEEIFINLKKDEIPLLNEYKQRLKEFENKWWIYSNTNITIPYLKGKLDNFYCIIPIKKWEWSHLVILDNIKDDNISLIDNKKWKLNISKDEFEYLINLYNWKYVLFVEK